MTALNTDKLKKLSRRWVGQIGSSGVTDAVVTTIPLSSATNLATDTAVLITIDRVSANGATTANLEETVIGVVSGNNLVSCVRGVEGTAQAHLAGSVVEVLVTAKGYNDIIDAILVEHSQLGVHSSALVTSLKATGAVVDTGTSDVTIVTPKAIADSKLVDSIRGDAWISAGESWTYNAVDKINVPAGAASKYSVGMKIKLTQTTAKYFYISIVADTVLTVNGAGLYTVANAAVTLPFYSSANQPLGFPINMIPGYVKCHVSLGTSQDNIADTTPTKINLDTEQYDIGGNFATNKFTAPVSGYYSIISRIQFEGVISGKYYANMIYLNGGAAIQGIAHSGNTNGFSVIASDIRYLAKDDYLELYAYVSVAAATTDITAGENDTFMSVALVSII